MKAIFIFPIRLALLLLLVSNTVFAQNLIRGRVVSAADGETLPGVSVSVTGTSDGNTTNVQGEYTINVKNDAVLRFHYPIPQNEIDNNSAISIEDQNPEY